MPLSRISKLFLDRDDTPQSETLAKRSSHAVWLFCGTEVGTSYTLQLAVLTAASVGGRCFPGAVCAVLPEGLAESRLLLWPTLGLRFGEALCRLSVAVRPAADYQSNAAVGTAVVFGEAPAPKRALRVTFDGWVAALGPADAFSRLPERDFCPLAGILAASRAMSEIFLSFAEITVRATRRVISLSLWNPRVDARDPAAIGEPIEYLPKELWILGLGHLGNAYLWALAGLPYRDPREIKVVLNDFDRVEPANVETGLLFTGAALNKYKTRVCSAWLEDRGFQSRIVERPFDEHFFCRSDEPRLALCGFDKNAARRPLETANFLRVVDSGLGGTVDNFDTLTVHALPNPRSAAELWPDVSARDREAEAQRKTSLVQHNRSYDELAGDECGRVELAGASVAVPFVGTTAASFVLAEVLRLFHGGPAYTDLKLRLSVPGDMRPLSAGRYSAHDAVLPFVCST